MSDDDAHLDEGFLEAQRERLEALREELLEVKGDIGLEAQHLQEDDAEIPGDDADEGSSMAQQEVDQSLQDLEMLRLAEVERALEKIEEGTYGLSDESGEPIPRERLEAKPDALYTVEEEEMRERLASRSG